MSLADRMYVRSVRGRDGTLLTQSRRDRRVRNIQHVLALGVILVFLIFKALQSTDEPTDQVMKCATEVGGIHIRPRVVAPLPPRALAPPAENSRRIPGHW